MGMPEAAMHEQDDPPAGQDHVRISRKILSMQAKTEAGLEKCLADDDLGFGVPCTNAGHHPASRCRVDDICHDLAPTGFGHIHGRRRKRAREHGIPTLRALGPLRDHLSSGRRMDAFIHLAGPYADLLQ